MHNTKLIGTFVFLLQNEEIRKMILGAFTPTQGDFDEFSKRCLELINVLSDFNCEIGKNDIQKLISFASKIMAQKLEDYLQQHLRNQEFLTIGLEDDPDPNVDLFRVDSDDWSMEDTEM